MEDFTLPDNDQVDFTLESYSQPDNDAVDFTPSDDVPGEDEPFDVGVDPLELPMGLNLPLRPLNLRTMEIGIAFFLIGLMSILLGAAAFLKNYAAGIMWSFALFALLASGLFQMGLELFWAMVAGVVLLLMAGMVARWLS